MNNVYHKVSLLKEALKRIKVVKAIEDGTYSDAIESMYNCWCIHNTNKDNSFLNRINNVTKRRMEKRKSK